MCFTVILLCVILQPVGFTKGLVILMQQHVHPLHLLGGLKIDPVLFVIEVVRQRYGTGSSATETSGRVVE